MPCSRLLCHLLGFCHNFWFDIHSSEHPCCVYDAWEKQLRYITLSRRLLVITCITYILINWNNLEKIIHEKTMNNLRLKSNNYSVVHSEGILNDGLQFWQEIVGIWGGLPGFVWVYVGFYGLVWVYVAHVNIQIWLHPGIVCCFYSEIMRWHHRLS